jgi:hypothetical protein
MAVMSSKSNITTMNIVALGAEKALVDISNSDKVKFVSPSVLSNLSFVW